MQLQEIEQIYKEIAQINELSDLHFLADEKHRYSVQYFAYYTHVPFLFKKCAELCKQSTVRILELGMGKGSSAILSYFAKNNQNILIDSIETDKVWSDQCFPLYYKGVQNVKPYYMSSYDSKYDMEDFKHNYDLIFVDQGDWSDRNKSLNYFKKQTKCFIVHDYDYLQRTWPDTHNMLWGEFNTEWDENWKQNRITDPPTLVCTL